MKLKIVKIGNSKGLRLPASIIEQCGFQSEVDAKIQNGVVILAPAAQVREGWAKAFENASNESGLEPLLDFENKFDMTDWEW